MHQSLIASILKADTSFKCLPSALGSKFSNFYQQDELNRMEYNEEVTARI
jgi:hypothetical protein